MRFIFLFTLVVTAGFAHAQAVDATQSEIDAYVKADRNQDGMIARSEFDAFINAVADAGQVTAQSIRFFDAYDYAFGFIDGNNDGLLSPQELRSAQTSYEN